MENWYKKNKFAFWTVVSSVVIILLIVFGSSIIDFAKGSGSLKITGLKPETQVFLDNDLKRTISEGDEGDIVIENVSKGIHAVLVARDAFWPWVKNIEIRARETGILSPFSVPQNTSGVFIPAADPEYPDIIRRFEDNTVPAAENPLISEDGTSEVWVDGGMIIARWNGELENAPAEFCTAGECRETMTVLSLSAPIRDLDYFPERSDVYIIALGQGVFAIERDNTNNQNFMPIFEGVEPEFLINTDSTNKSIYVLDDGGLSAVALDF